jgi:aminopeptidase YwaD
MRVDPAILAKIASDGLLWTQFQSLCDCGGRLAGTDSERRALALVKDWGRAATGVEPRSVPVPYAGWRARGASLGFDDGSSTPCHPLVRTISTPPEGLRAEVIDLGRGTIEEFKAHEGEIKRRIVLVRHELMFAAGTIHRRRKYDMARAMGAVGFLIAGPLPGSPVAGSSGRELADGIPAVGVSPETAARLRRRASGWPTVTLTIATEETPTSTETLLFDIPGATEEWVVLSAHIDGHDLAESAMDNATGVVAALAVARALAPLAAKFRRGLRVAFFSAEEWALTGSAQYVRSLSPIERATVALNVNLDSIAGSPSLTALTSGFAELEPFVLGVAEKNGHVLRTVRPLMINSDHGNFALAGIPALRLVAGFDDPRANLRFVLTAADTRDKVAESELRQASALTGAMVAAACNASPEEARRWRSVKPET